MNKIEEKRQREISIVTKMIEVYCKKKHGTKDGLCPECQELLDYATMRSNHCPFMETKTFCANCHVHCYKPEMRERIKNVMRFCGPRMLLYYPLATIRHLIESIKEKRKLEKQK